MKTFLTVTFLAALLACGAVAQSVPPPSGLGPILGLYTTPTIGDETAAVVAVEVVPLTIQIYVVLSYSEVASIGGAEFRIEFSSDLAGVMTVNSVTTDDPEWVNVAWPDVYLTWCEPRAVVDEHVVLAVLDVTINNEVVGGEVYLTPTANPTVDGAMAFVSGDDYETILTMNPNSLALAYDAPAFRVTAGAVAVQGSSWSGVKALFE